MKQERWAVLISGTGSNLQTLLDRTHDPLPIKVYSSKPGVPGISKAHRMGIPVQILDSKPNWQELHKDLLRLRVQKIFLLGFMKIVPENFIQLWENKIINLHPSLLPLYPGLNSFDRAWDDGAKLGASIHIVTSQLDAGAVIRQKTFLRSKNKNWDRIRLAFAEQSLVREVFENEYL